MRAPQGPRWWIGDDRRITYIMMNACTACGRPVPLSRDEIGLLLSADAAPSGVPVPALPASSSACVRPLVRMGYLVKTANDDGPRGRAVLITERGRDWLVANLRR
jgi:hypothetical protein